MRRNRLLAFVALLVTATMTQGQMISVPGPREIGDLPATGTDGQFAIRGDDYQTFFWSSTVGRWLGDTVVLVFNRRIADHSGVLRLGETSTSAAVPGLGGFFASSDSFRVMRIKATSSDLSTTVACTLSFFADADTLMQAIWTANEQSITPTADSTGGWRAPEDVFLPAGEVLSASVNGGGSPLPDFPIITVELKAVGH